LKSSRGLLKQAAASGRRQCKPKRRAGNTNALPLLALHRTGVLSSQMLLHACRQHVI
jgi:hypothetical protein